VLFNLYLFFVRIIKQGFKSNNPHTKAFEIGKRAAQGYNIYLTFGSDKTITKDADDSYRRYSMAMKHYGQVLCEKEGFILGYEHVEMGRRSVK
jgi:hypothetical protein